MKENLISIDKMTQEKLQSIVDTCNDHARYKTGKYNELTEVIESKSRNSLKEMGVSYHYSCNKTFTKDKVYIRRAHDREK